MNTSPIFGFNLPNSENPEELADVNAVSENFLKVEEILNSSEKKLEKKVTGIKTTVINKDSTDEQIPSAKAAFDALQNVEIEVDSELSATSTNPVQNKVISSNVSNALQASVSGNPIRLDDISPIEHEMKVSVDGKDPELIARGDIVKTDVTEEGLYTISGFEEFHDDIGNLYCKILFNNGKHYSVSVWDCIPFFDTCEEFIESAGLKVGDVVFVGWEVVVDSADGGWFNLYSPVTVKKYGKNLLPVRRELSLPTDNNFSVDCNIPAPFVFSMTFNITASATAAGGAVFQLTYDDGTVSSIAASSWDFQSLTGIITKNLAINNGKTLVKVSFPNWAKLTATIYDMQIEAGTVATEYEPYVETITYTTGENGRVSIPSLYPTTTLLADSGATITAEYNIDTKKYIDKKIAELQALVLEV